MATRTEATSSRSAVEDVNTGPPSQQAPQTVSVPQRFLFSCLWTPFGLVFFYVVMVALSSISEGLTLERLAQNGWPRVASRHTGVVTAPVFALFLMITPSSLWSLFMAIMVCCSHFAHFVILHSDLRVHVDEVVVRKMLRLESTHPIFRLLPMWTAHVVRTIGFLAMLVVSSERCYGSPLGKRERWLPFISQISCIWVWGVFNLWFVDRLLCALLENKDQQEIVYPLYFIAMLLIGAVTAVRRERNWDMYSLSAEKKTN